jgi:hypothetical protein
MKLRIGAYLTVLGWYLIASAALIGGTFWGILPSFGPMASVVLIPQRFMILL